MGISLKGFKKHKTVVTPTPTTHQKPETESKITTQNQVPSTPAPRAHA